MKLNNDEYEKILLKMTPEELCLHLAKQINTIYQRLEEITAQKYLSIDGLRAEITEDFCYNRFKNNLKKYNKEFSEEVDNKTKLVENIIKWAGWLLFLSAIISKIIGVI